MSIACAAVMALCAACDTSDNGGGATSESTVCTSVGTTWWNQAFTDQTGTFHVEFAATPSRNKIDAVVGLSAGSASTWTKLAAIVRFNPDGFIDARNGASYTATVQQGYVAGETFYIRIDVDVRAHTYSAWASREQGQYGSWNQVATNYAFRTEQASVTHLNNVAGFVNTTTPGSLQVCGFSLDTLPASGCSSATATHGFVNEEVTPAINSMIVHLTATPSTANMDGVIGVAYGVADEYNDLAASLRFYTNGMIEARDGDTYRADTSVPYSAGQQFDVMFAIDISNHTYSVFVRDSRATDETELARGYHFRTQQQAVTRLDHVATIVASSTGRVDVCGAYNREPLNVQYVREGRVDVQRFKPAPVGDGLLVTDGSTTQKLDANGKIVGALAVGGELAVDTDGSIYVAHTTQSTLTVDAFSSTLAPRWSTTIANDFNLGRIAVSQGHVLVTLAGSPGVRVESFATRDGTASIVGSHPINDGTNMGVGGGFVFATPQNTNTGVSGFVIEAYDVAGNRRWSRTYAGNFWVSEVDVAPDGSVVFGGEFYDGTMSFGDRTMYAVPKGNGDGYYNGYFVALSPTGGLRYSQQTYAAVVADIDTTNNQIAVASFHNGDALYVDYRVVDLSGNSLAGCSACNFDVSPHGDAVDIALGPSRVYLTVLHDMPDPPIGGSLWPFRYALNL